MTFLDLTPCVSFLVLLCLAAPAAGQEKEAERVPVVVTQGEAIVRRAPDRAFVDVAVETRAKTPKEATTNNARVMTAVQQKLRGLGLEAEAIQTRGYELTPEFDYVNGRQVTRGFAARNRIEVRVDRLEHLADVIDTAVAAGATNAGSIRFDLRERDTVERQALRDAVADARARAEAAATGAGLAIRRVVRIEETGRPHIPPPMPYLAAAREMKQAEATPISAGEIEIRASVTLTVELTQR